MDSNNIRVKTFCAVLAKDLEKQMSTFFKETLGIEVLRMSQSESNLQGTAFTMVTVLYKEI